MHENPPRQKRLNRKANHLNGCESSDKVSREKYLRMKIPQGGCSHHDKRWKQENKV